MYNLWLIALHMFKHVCKYVCMHASMFVQSLTKCCAYLCSKFLCMYFHVHTYSLEVDTLKNYVCLHMHVYML
jgi:hypothetical protein